MSSERSEKAEKTSVVYALLPLVSVLPETKLVKEATDLLEELDAIEKLIDMHVMREVEIKSALAVMQKVAGTQGLRYGDLCFVERQMPGRESLKVEKLMEVTGITATQLKACTVSGKPYVQRVFKNLAQTPKRAAEDQNEK